MTGASERNVSGELAFGQGDVAGRHIHFEDSVEGVVHRHESVIVEKILERIILSHERDLNLR